MRHRPPPPPGYPPPPQFTQQRSQEYDSGKDRDRAIQRLGKDGWQVLQVTQIPGHYRGKRGCLLFVIFPPLALLAGRTNDRWLVVYGR